MDDTIQKVSRTIWIGIGLVIVLIAVSFVLSKVEPKRHVAPLPVIGSVSDFNLTNQSGEPVTLASLRGKVWVADIIFTRCAGPCPRMTKQMAELQAALPKDSGAKLITLTTDPEFDTPEILKRYATRFNADAARWNFFTGTKPQIAALAIDSLKLTALEKAEESRANPDDLFVHSTIFVIVDKQARLRGAIETDGDGIEWTNVQPAILSAIGQLERER